MTHIPNMCHHGVDCAVEKCGRCFTEKAAIRDPASRGIEPIAKPSGGNCLLRIVGDPNYLHLDSRVWQVLWDLALELVALREESQRLTKENAALLERGMTFMVTGGPVVMAEKFDAMKTRAGAAESSLARAQEENAKLREALPDLDEMTLEDCSRGLDPYVSDPDIANAQKCVEAIRTMMRAAAMLKEGE